MPKGIYKQLTKAEEQKIIKEYLEKPVKRLADELGVSFGRIERFLKKRNLVIPRDIIEQRIKDSQLKKGSVPPNKGKKQTEYMTAEAIERAAKTRFKKGNEPVNTSYDGCISIRWGKSKRPYKFIRLSKGKWQLLHRKIWEEKNGKIPKRHVLAFKDGNTMNCDISNLELVSFEENMYRNSKVNYPKEVIPTMVLINKLNKKIQQNG